MTLLRIAPATPAEPADVTQTRHTPEPTRVANLSDKLQRLQRAQETLATAETKHGLRSVVTPLRPTQPTQNNAPNGEDATPQETTPTNPHTETLTRSDRTALPIHPALTELLPHGLQRGAITTIQGSTYTALTLIAQTTATGGWAAIVGAPNINYIAAHDIGVDLDRVIIIPNTGEHTPDIIATLIDGVDLILLGPHITLTHAEQRTLSARNRDRGTHIISHQPWTGARSHLTTNTGTWTGLTQGIGRLTTCTYTITKANRHHTTHTCTITSTNGTPHPTTHTPTTHALTAHTRTEKTG